MRVYPPKKRLILKFPILITIRFHLNYNLCEGKRKLLYQGDKFWYITGQKLVNRAARTHFFDATNWSINRNPDSMNHLYTIYETKLHFYFIFLFYLCRSKNKNTL